MSEVDAPAVSGLLTEDVPLDDFLPYLINRIAGRLNFDLAEDLRRMGVNQQYWRLLAVLTARDGRTINELAVYTVTPQSTLSRTVDRMEQEGLVAKRGLSGDGRVVTVFLTPAGRNAFDRILPVAMDHCRNATRGLTKDEATTLIRLLKTVLGNIRQSPYA
ncbi:MAG TPA: MarR family winged helix-turn-helix transcriptional regulator [Alphaproteobacteria bacterium]|nr:MarR family winged helix-turn-helix transcriptional regulator [Alphaproteobacteria bacterium]